MGCGSFGDLKMKYQIYKDGFTSNCTHCDFYNRYEMYEFDADDDADAFKKAESYQHKCEQNMLNAGVDPSDWDPSFVQNVSRYNAETDDFENIEY